MLVGERLSKPVITISPDMPITEAINLFKKEHIRRAPVIKDGKLIGIVTEGNLINASPSAATTLSIWEMNYLLTKIKVSEVMTKNVMTVTEDTPIEQAARIMADNKIGGVPVMRDGYVVGIITETDLFKLFLELMGAREMGVRVTALVTDKPGGLAELSAEIAAQKGNFVSFGVFVGEDSSNRMVTFKVSGMDLEQVKKAIQPHVKEIIDIRM
ncbi:MAG: CBS domain-containing protein [Anaerolineae bacterium]|jgi:acetoin utilization protein AcuB|nr:CBS domain-containing protein [Anaerolineae bacterium]